MKPKTKFGFEKIFWILSSLTLIFGLSASLLSPQNTLSHDNFYLHYPTFSFFIESIAHGTIPLWNPFTHGGEPFYPIIEFLRLMDPIGILIGTPVYLLTGSTSLAYNWQHVGQNLFLILGVYLFVRPWLDTLWLKAFVIVTLHFSAWTYTPLRQSALIGQFQWIPWSLIVLKQIYCGRDYRWRNFLALTFLMILPNHGYWFTGTWILLQSLAIGCLLYQRKNFLEFLSECGVKKIAFFCAAILFSFGPTLAVLMSSREWLVPMRLIPANFQNIPPAHAAQLFSKATAEMTSPSPLDYSALAYAGSFLRPDDLIQLLSPNGNYISRKDNWVWGNTSEAFIYFGIIGYFLSVIGFFFTKGVWIRILRFSTAIIVFILLGSSTPIHRILFYLFPAHWALRHSSQLAFLLLLSLLIFAILGWRVVVSCSLEKATSKPRITGFVLFVSLHLFLLFHRNPYWVHQGLYLFFVIFFSVIGGVALKIFLRFGRSTGIDRATLISFALLCGTLFDLRHVWKRTDSLRLGMRAAAPSAVLPFFEAPPPESIPTREFMSDLRFQLPNPRTVPEQEPRYSELLSHTFTAVGSIVATGLPAVPRFFPEVSTIKIWATYFEGTRYNSLVFSDLPRTKKDFLFGIGQPIFSVTQNLIYPFGAPAGKIQILQMTPNRFDLEIDTNSGYLYWTNTYDKNWRATIDSKPTPIVVANERNMTVPLSPGRHDVTLQYIPMGYLAALTANVAELILLLLAMVVCELRSPVRVMRPATPGRISPPEPAIC